MKIYMIEAEKKTYEAHNDPGSQRHVKKLDTQLTLLWARASDSDLEVYANAQLLAISSITAEGDAPAWRADFLAKARGRRAAARQAVPPPKKRRPR